MDERIIRNRAKCRKCGDVIESRYRHEFAWCKCGAIAVDGGKAYLRRVGNPGDCEDLSEFEPKPSGPIMTMNDPPTEEDE